MPVQATRTWQDMSASRALDTEYTNTNSYPIEVSVCLSTADSHLAYLEVSSVSVVVITGLASQGITHNIRATVPAGATYKITTSLGTYTVVIWAELR
jgi:hypothetical protein